MLYFITGSQGKFREVKAILPEVEMLEMDLPEIQGIDAKKIIEAKLEEATKHHAGEFIVEDTGPGLCIQQQEYMFQLFGKAQFSDDKLQTGIGVKLTYCK